MQLVSTFRIKASPCDTPIVHRHNKQIKCIGTNTHLCQYVLFLYQRGLTHPKILWLKKHQPDTRQCMLDTELGVCQCLTRYLYSVLAVSYQISYFIQSVHLVAADFVLVGADDAQISFHSGNDLRLFPDAEVFDLCRW